MTEPKTKQEMIGETFREAGTLICVFSLLDPLIQGKSFRFGWLVGVVVAGLIFIWLGVTIECRRSR